MVLVLVLGLDVLVLVLVLKVDVLVLVLKVDVLLTSLVSVLVLGTGIARGQYYWVLDIGCLSWYRSNPTIESSESMYVMLEWRLIVL